MIDSPQAYEESYSFRLALEPTGILASGFRPNQAELAALLQRQRFIADRGEGVGLVTYVNNIDLAYSLTAPASSPTAITTSTSSASTSSSSALAKKNAHHHRPTPHAAPTGRVEPPAARAVRGPAVSLAGRMWRCARVFISSTFRFAGQGVREGARAYHLFMMYIYIDFVVS